MSNPKTPIRSDYRLIKKLLSQKYGKKVEIIPKEVNTISENFTESGGSWVKLHEGCPEQLSHLKRIIKIMVQNKQITKKQLWDKKI